ncbi:transglycosylase family protein [Gordonia alkanivorans]|uniref:transglycosylase family protein n=1 Tax=Gordonia alkanivorans TaxID=84096 RepID=UPI0004B348C1|nr:transglycosylase family protein [Gordonia alkanivorans]
MAGAIASVVGNDAKAKRSRKRLYIAVAAIVFLQVMLPVIIVSMVVGIALMAAGTGVAGTVERDEGKCLDIQAPRITHPGGTGGSGRGGPGASAGTLGAPLDEQYMASASGFGQREAPTAGATAWHDGIDFSAAGIHGKPIYAPADGVVAQAGPASGYGNWIIIDHTINGQKVSTLYGHIENGHVLVNPGDHVSAGQHIADVGNAGVSTGPHLHFGVYPGGWKSGAGVDPMPWLSKFKASARTPDSPRGPPATNLGSTDGPGTTTPPGVVSKADWQKLAQCESGGDWKIDTGNGFSGGIQFTPSSWAAAGGTEFAAAAHLASPEQQMEAANKLLKMQGWGAWPTCSANQQLAGLKPAPEGTFARKGDAPPPANRAPPPQQATPLPASPKGDERNLQAAAQRAMRLIAHEFPAVQDIGGHRSGGNARDHGIGAAVDAMIPEYGSAEGISLGDRIAQRFIDNAGELKVKYVIWRNRIWQNGQWSDYGASGDDNTKHNNHVHISFHQSGPPTSTVTGLPGTTRPGPTAGADSGPEGIAPYTPEGEQKNQSLTPEQQANIKALIAAAKRSGIEPEGRAAVLAIAYAGAQTNFVSLMPTADDPRMGIFGEVPLEGAGDITNLINVPYAANAFFARLKQVADSDREWATKPLAEVLVATYPEQATRAPEFGTWEQLAIGATQQLWGDPYARPDASLQLVSSTDCVQGVIGGGFLKPGTVPERFVKWITLAGRICEGITAPLLASQIAAESNFSEQATSEDGAEGPSQFMPGTWQTWGKKVDGNGKAIGPPGSGDPRNVADATMAQGHMMCADYENMKRLVASGRVKGDPVALTIAAYNAGLGAVLEAGGMPSGGDYTTQTQPYVEKILANARKYDGGGGQLAPNRSASGGLQKAVEVAMQQRGKPYDWGAAGPDSFDCSGLTSYAYKAAGIQLPRTTYDQIKLGTEVSLEQAQPGDLVFSNFSDGGRPEHVALYIGEGKVVEAQQEGTPVLVASIPKGKIVIKQIDAADTRSQ